MQYLARGTITVGVPWCFSEKTNWLHHCYHGSSEHGKTFHRAANCDILVLLATGPCTHLP